MSPHSIWRSTVVFSLIGLLVVLRVDGTLVQLIVLRPSVDGGAVQQSAVNDWPSTAQSQYKT